MKSLTLNWEFIQRQKKLLSTGPCLAPTLPTQRLLWSSIPCTSTKITSLDSSQAGAAKRTQTPHPCDSTHGPLPRVNPRCPMFIRWKRNQWGQVKAWRACSYLGIIRGRLPTCLSKSSPLNRGEKGCSRPVAALASSHEYLTASTLERGMLLRLVSSVAPNVAIHQMLPVWCVKPSQSSCWQSSFFTVGKKKKIRKN